MEDFYPVAGALDIFLHDHAQIFTRQRRTGGDPHGFAGFQLARFPIGGVQRVHDPESFGIVVRQNCIAVASGAVAIGKIFGGTNCFAQDTAKTFFQRRARGGQRQAT